MWQDLRCSDVWCYPSEGLLLCFLDVIGFFWNLSVRIKKKIQYDNTRYQATAPPQPTREKRNTTDSPPNHLHTDNNNCKYYPIIIYTYHTHTHNQLSRITTLTKFTPTHFLIHRTPHATKKAQGTNASDTYIPKKPNHVKINRKNTTEDLHPDDTRHPSKGDPATTSTK